MNLFKLTILGVLLSFITFTLYSQAPQSFSYQAVIRDESGSLVQEEVISVQIALKQGSVDGAIIYAERHAALTNQNGLITLKIGEGSASTGDFQEIDWSNSPFYIETSVDLDGGTNYNIVTTSELLSVPFALYADKAQRSEKADYSDRALIADSVLNLPNNLVRQENQQLELRGDTLFLSDSNFVVLSNLSILNTFSKIFGGSNLEAVNSIKKTQNGGYIIIGWTYSSDGDIGNGNNGGADIWVIKIDSKGFLEWEKTFGGSENDFGLDIISSRNGGYLLIGTTYSSDGDIGNGNNGGADIWVIKIDSEGFLEWEKTFGGSESDFGFSIIESDKETILFSGLKIIQPDSNLQILNFHPVLMKLNQYGELEQEKLLLNYSANTNINIEYTVIDIFLSNNQTIFLTCSIIDTNLNDANNIKDSGILLIKFNSTLEIEWEKVFSERSEEISYQGIQLKDQGFVICGSVKPENTESDTMYNNAYVLRLDSTGEILWSKSFGNSNNDAFYAIKEASDGGIIAAGNVDNKMYVVKLNGFGEIIWQNHFSNRDSSVFSIEESDDGFIILVADDYSLNDIRILKITSAGQLLNP